VTKTEANYKEPRFCCACKQFCFKHGLWWCNLLFGEVEETGVCDYYEVDKVMTATRKKTGQPLKEEKHQDNLLETDLKMTCANCKYAYYKDGIPWCNRVDVETNANNVCQEWEYE